jgi:hypothetical protein
MSPELPLQSGTIKGALMTVRSDSQGQVIDPNTNIFVFQYNPEMLTRTLSYPNQEEASTDDERVRYNKGLPTELINLTLELDAADQLEVPGKHPDTVQNGLYPSLAALESMMYSESFEARQAKPPVVLFIWGPKRMVPVRLVSLKVSEEAFDPKLNPIRTKIDICMRVVERSELRKGSLGYHLYGTHLNQKNSMALLYRQRSLVRKYFEKVASDIRQNLAAENSQLRKRTNVKSHKTQRAFRHRNPAADNKR